MTNEQANKLIDEYVLLAGPSRAGQLLDDAHRRLAIVKQLGGRTPIKRTQPAVTDPVSYERRWGIKPQIIDTDHASHVLLCNDVVAM